MAARFAAALAATASIVPCCAAVPPHTIRLERLARVLSEAATDDASPASPQRKYGAVPVYEFGDPDSADAMYVHAEREMPFVLRGAPGMSSAEARWTPAYLKSQLGRGAQMHWFDGQYFQNSVVMYSVAPLSEMDAEAFWAAWAANTSLAAQAARRARAQALAGAPPDVAGHHNSMYLQATGASAPFITEDLPLFWPPERGHRESALPASGLWGDPAVTAITVPECRFGLPGIRIEAHFDTYANVIAMVSGYRRIVIAPPSECSVLSVSQAPARLRHSMLDWGDPSVWGSAGFQTARGTSVTLGPGDVLFLPPYWFHYIKSLSATAQCSKMVAKATPPYGALQCLADESFVLLSRAPILSPPSEDSSAAFLFGSLITREYEGGVTVPESDASVLFAALDPGWRAAPWMQVALAEPFSDYAAARRAIKNTGVIGMLFRAWETWVVRPVFGTDLLAWFTSLNAAAESVPRGVSAPFVIDLYRKIAKISPLFACAPPASKEPFLRLDTTLRCKIPSLGSDDTFTKTTVDIEVRFAAIFNKTLCQGAGCVVDQGFGVEGEQCTPPSALELSLLFRGSTHGASAASSTVDPTTSPRMGRAAATIRLEATPAKEFAQYTWTLRPGTAGSNGAGDLLSATTSGRDWNVSVSATLFTLPSYRGAWGFARRLRSNTFALWRTVGGPPWLYLQAVGSALLQAFTFPVLAFIIVIHFCVRWRAVCRRSDQKPASEKED